MTCKIDLPQLELSMLREVLLFLQPSVEREVWLVGGSIRDLLKGVHNLPDLDLATSFNPIPAAREYARKTGAGFVVLDDERHVVRLVRACGDGHLTFDISAFRAESFSEDLRARDFTINAIAASLNGDISSGKLEVFDPLHGCEHLEQGLIIPCSDQLFIDDPLRLMRAFRFSALFNADFSPELRQMITEQAPMLKSVSGERIRDEFFKVLGVGDSIRWIRIMHETGILRVVLPELHACCGVEQNDWHHLDVFEHTLLALENLEKLLAEKKEFVWWPAFIKYLDEPLSGTRTYAQSLKLGCLVHDLGKPACRRIDSESGRVIFHGHEMEGVHIAKDISERLRLSANEMLYLQKMAKNHMRPGVMIQQGINDKRLFRFFSETGRDGLGVALLSLADRLAALGTLNDGEIEDFTAGIMMIMQQFYDQMQKPHAAPFLNGTDLIRQFSLKPGPEFKRILDTLEEAQFLGEVTSRDQALALVKTLLS